MRVEDMSDSQVEEYLASRSSARQQAHKNDGRASLEYSLVCLITGLLGMWASASLLLAERALLKDPTTALACDLNPLVGCSRFLSSSVNTLFFGVPNALWGLMFFSGISALAIAFFNGFRPHMWFVWMLNVAMCVAGAWLIWFQFTSINVEKALCPYCLLTWIVTIPLIIHTWLYNARNFSAPPFISRLYSWRWLAVVLVYIVLALVVIVSFRDMWGLLF